MMLRRPIEFWSKIPTAVPRGKEFFLRSVTTSCHPAVMSSIHHVVGTFFVGPVTTSYEVIGHGGTAASSRK